jgi:hypothetical protein
MTIVQANQTIFLISDLVTEVILRLENRTTDTARAAIWLRDALLEISGNTDYRDDFDALEILGPVFNLTIGQQEYSFVNIVPIQSLPYQSGFNLATLDVFLWTDYPTNAIRRKLNMTSYQDADKYQSAQSIPTEWYRFGDTIGLSPTPNQPYQIQARILQRHPINDDQLEQTQILLPREWNEILIWAAVMRGFAELLQFEKSSEIRTLLQGDPKFPGKPGLIESVKKRRKREGWRQESSLRHIISGYGWGS